MKPLMKIMAGCIASFAVVATAIWVSVDKRPSLGAPARSSLR